MEINRASILAVGTVGLIYMLYRKHLVMLFFVIFAAIGGLLYALSLDDAVVEDLPRNIKEAILLMKGDDIYNHISSYQRVYEGQKVMEDYETATDAEWLFGMGLGRTVDMTGAADRRRDSMHCSAPPKSTTSTSCISPCSQIRLCGLAWPQPSVAG